MSNPAKVVSTAPLLTISVTCLIFSPNQPDNEAKWTKLVKIAYKDPNGTERTWESAERRTRPKNSEIDGVGIVAILEKSTGPEIILQKQFRPPLDKVTIEVPAGLVDAGETAEQSAVRELKEETGYVGKASETSTIMFNDPGFTNTNLRMVHVTIDMSLPGNQNPKPELEESEFIEVFTVPLSKLWEECKKLEAEGCAIDARVGPSRIQRTRTIVCHHKLMNRKSRTTNNPYRGGSPARPRASRPATRLNSHCPTPTDARDIARLPQPPPRLVQVYLTHPKAPVPQGDARPGLPVPRRPRAPTNPAFLHLLVLLLLGLWRWRIGAAPAHRRFRWVLELIGAGGGEGCLRCIMAR
ncbi:ADP-ribose pyrophosphatase [Pyricularia oryzae Y34]|uniref:Nudix hydrolase domain-containing protein n=3 Tax=Pyricularia oryzae TaxID=318829 RepID=Q2KGQ1_PYRO7|nr:hypothetical protein MGCH7_ch7g284 [Pyricularia oryzae 70-15]ELQ44038.1 ADP-ribose pyrophosphatase [Pyricularia oryzae Y34]